MSANRIDWNNNNSSVDSYNIYKSTTTFDENNLPTVLDNVSNTDNYYVDYNVVSATTYYYRIGNVVGGNVILSRLITITT